MAKKKLQSFSADDASDVFTPTVKTFVSAEAPIPSIPPEPSAQLEIAPKIEKTTVSQTESPSDPPNRSQTQTSDQTEMDKPSVSQLKKDPKSVEANQAPVDKAIKPEPVAPSILAPKSVKAPENAPAPKPPVKPETKPAVPKKTQTDRPAPTKMAQQKQPEAKEKPKAASQTHIELVGFILGKEEYAIEINKVQDINRMVEITRVPKAPDFVEGVMNLRGKVLPVIHLRKRFNMPDKPFDRSSRIIVVEVAGSVMGFIVDAITEVLRVPSHIVEQAPDLVTGIDSEYIMGVGKLENRLLILIDLGKVLTKKTS
jgi:purine-binding chemotaxis protein CheW